MRIGSGGAGARDAHRLRRVLFVFSWEIFSSGFFATFLQNRSLINGRMGASQMTVGMPRVWFPAPRYNQLGLSFAAPFRFVTKRHRLIAFFIRLNRTNSSAKSVPATPYQTPYNRIARHSLLCGLNITDKNSFFSVIVIIIFSFIEVFVLKNVVAVNSALFQGFALYNMERNNKGRVLVNSRIALREILVLPVPFSPMRRLISESDRQQCFIDLKLVISIFEILTVFFSLSPWTAESFLSNYNIKLDTMQSIGGMEYYNMFAQNVVASADVPWLQFTTSGELPQTLVNHTALC